MPTRGERRIQTWEIPAGGTSYKVDVYLVDKRYEYARAGDASVPRDAKSWFRAENEVAALKIEDVNIDKLRKRAEEYVHQWAQIEWNLFLHVNTYAGDGSVEFDFKWLAVGTRKDGKRVHVEVGTPHGCRPFCEDKSPEHVHDDGVDEEKGTWSGWWRPPTESGWSLREGMPEVGKHRPGYGQGRSHSLVPATPDSFAACWRFKRALEALGKQIEARFSPKLIENTLADIASTLPRLPGPKEERK